MLPALHRDGVKRKRLLRLVVCLVAVSLVLPDVSVFAANEHRGQVTFGGLPVPGAMVTAKQGGKQFVAITDAQGMYEFLDLGDGPWTIQVEMRGFATESREITLPSDAAPVWELKLLPFEEITKGLPPAQVEPDAPPSPPNGVGRNARTPPPSASGGFQRANVNATANAATPAAPPANDTGASGAESSEDLNQRAATGLLVNGSVNNGAASPFAQTAAFGNNRRGLGWLYNGNLGVIFGTSVWDARPFSTTGLSGPKPSYNDAQFVVALGGPIGVPHHVLAGSLFFVGYQHAANHNAVIQWGRVPTSLERAGDFSQTLSSTGQPVQIIDPSTGLAFAGATIPTNRISPQAAALLALYPLPNTSSGQFNYQIPVLTRIDQDNVQSRFSKNMNNKNQVFGTFAYQLSTTTGTNLFGFQDVTRTSGIDLVGNWSRWMSNGFVAHLKYEFSRLGTDDTPYFADRTNVSAAAGILGNNQDPVNWGPPNLAFSSGLAGLSQSQYARNANQIHAFGYDGLWYKRRHTVGFGADVRYQQLDINSQQNARGIFGFTGAATQASANGVPIAGTGSDVADFLLGIPDTSSIAFGNADKNLRGWAYDAFINDILRLTSSFTLNLGVRWEYARPLTETQGRLVNLDIAPGFTSATQVLGSNPTGVLASQSYSSSLLRSEALGLEPRVGIAWRPIPASPLIIRAGYGIYNSTSVYPLIATQLAQQPPFSKTFSVQNSAATPLTLTNGFNVTPPVISNTFAVDPNFHVAYVHTWNVSVQEDLPGSLTMTATYLGAKGSRLMQEFLPNTFPVGAANPCPTCPSGFVYLTSDGTSLRNAGQIQVRRRLRNGITATAQYTLAKATDDASGFTGAAVTSLTAPGTAAGASLTTLNGAAIAQNWLDLEAERSRSTFDQRHQFTFQAQYTAGEGLGGGAFLSGWKGALFKRWTLTSQLTFGSGLPLTPVYPVALPGTGLVGVVRPDSTGAPIDAAPAGRYLNPAAFAAPLPGQWGNAGRNSITGPAQFALDASIGRAFPIGTRLSGDLRMDATNVLNHVTFTSWNTTVGSSLFGLPNQANTMRKLQITFRVRF
jgi:trimeric autotransporter adhesin